MELPVCLQLRELGCALLFGVGTGLLYDLLRPLRRSRWCTIAADALYALLLFFALLAFALYAGRGRLRLFALSAMALSGGLWIWRISPLFRRLEALRLKFSRRLVQQFRNSLLQKKKNSKNGKKKLHLQKNLIK